MLRNCPSCQKEFEITDEETDINRRFSCPHCLTMFEVTWLFPLTLDYIEENSCDPNRSIETTVT